MYTTVVALTVLRAQEMSESALQTVYQATVMAKLLGPLYAASACRASRLRQTGGELKPPVAPRDADSVAQDPGM